MSIIGSGSWSYELDLPSLLFPGDAGDAAFRAVYTINGNVGILTALTGGLTGDGANPGGAVVWDRWGRRSGRGEKRWATWV